MPGKLKVELDLETVQALRTALNAGGARTAGGNEAPAGRGSDRTVRASGGAGLSLNLLLKTVAATVASYDKAAEPARELPGRTGGASGPDAAADKPAPIPGPRQSLDEFPPSGPTPQTPTEHSGGPQGLAGGAAEATAGAFHPGDRLPVGGGAPAPGTTVINNFTNYYAVPVQRSSEAPSEWADGMVST